jgi:hypothetical protein
MKGLFVFLIFMLPLSSFGAFGMLGNDQCAYQASSFPTSSSDNRQVVQAQIQELENNRIKIDAQINLVSTDLLKLQGYMKKYFAPRGPNSPPWADTMQAHMDNAMDCCAPQGVPATVTSQYSKYNSGQRLPAGNDYEGETTAPQTAEPVRPEPIPVNALPVEPTVSVPSSANSCCGYSSQYCSQDWARGNYKAPPAGAAPICLQTGFSATPAWYYGACRNGGEIDPQVCSDPRIANAPNDAANCAIVLNSYRKAAKQKRELASGLSQINIQIQALKYPNRPTTGSSETTTADGSNALGKILGSVAQIALPLIFNQVASYQAEKDVRYTSGPAGATPLYRNNRQGPPAGATYFGPNYGYGFSNNGVYGGQPPALKTGGFGCSTGTLGAGINLMSLLFGGGRTNFNAQGGISATFGATGGGLLSSIGNFLFGNQNAYVPPYRFGGFNPPYQVGGIYGVRGAPAGSTRVTAGTGNVSNYFSGGNAFPAGATAVGLNNLPPIVNTTGSGRSGAPASAILYPASNSTGYLSSTAYQTPYFGNMGSVLQRMFATYSNGTTTSPFQIGN